MTRPYIPFFAFLALLLLTIPFSGDFATSVVPGWHVTIYPPYFIWGLALTAVLLFVVIGYWLLSKRVDKTNWTLFIIHLLLTVPAIVFMKFPSVLMDANEINGDELARDLYFRIKLIPWTQGLFIVGQVLFLIYFIRTLQRKTHKIERL